MDASELVGTTFDGRFQLERLLGQGGMGAVYLAFHEVLQRHFALKVIHQSLLAEGDLEQMFRREARAASRVQHPHVTFVFDYNSVEGIPYIVMEYVEGATLAHELGVAKRAGKPFPLIRCLDILAQVADALSAAHACGVVHRDLKPANVALTTRRGRKDFVKVLDFGLAKLVKGSTTFNAIDSNAVFGTPEYMSPEQCLMQGDGEIDHRSDIYGLGIMAFEILSGAPPFVGEPLQVLYAHQEKPPPTLYYTNGKDALPTSLVELVMACLAKDPERRPQSAQDVAGELLAILGELRGDALMPEETAVLPVFGPPANVREVKTTTRETSAGETQISDDLPDPDGRIVYVDAETHALGDLVRSLRERNLGGPNTVHLYTRMLEMDDSVAELEHESDLVHGQILHLEMRSQEREARLREALVEVEHEMARQTGRETARGPNKTPLAASAERELRRLTRRAEEIASHINQISGELEGRLSDLEAHLIALQALLGERREDASNLRSLLRRQLSGLRGQLPPDDDELLALFLTASVS